MKLPSFQPTFNTKAFTLVEIVVIISVLVILITITGFSYTAIVDQSREQTVRNDLKAVATNLSKYRADNGAFPTAAIFNTSAIEKSQSSDTATTYAYTYNSSDGSYCLQATHVNQTFYVRNSNTEPVRGTC